MEEKLKKKLLNSITMVSGLAGLSNIDFTKKSTSLPKEKWLDSMSFIETGKGLKISLAIVVNADIRTKVITYEIWSIIKSILKQQKIKTESINIYVRGVSND